MLQVGATGTKIDRLCLLLISIKKFKYWESLTYSSRYLSFPFRSSSFIQLSSSDYYPYFIHSVKNNNLTLITWLLYTILRSEYGRATNVRE
jgi:hypothetical protein